MAENLESNPVTENESVEEIKELQDVTDDFEVVVADEPVAADEDEETDEIDEETDEIDEETDEIDEETDEIDEETDEIDEDEEDEDDDLKSYSKNVQKRIRREVKLRKLAEDSVRKATTQRNALVQASQQFVQENGALQEKYDNLEDQYVDLLTNSLSSKLEGTQNSLIQAKDGGDTAEELRLQSELEELRFNKRHLDEYRTGLTTTREERKKQAQPPQHPANAVPKAVEWVKKNRTWLEKPENAPVVAYMRAVDAQLSQEGYDPNSTDYYREVDKRIDSAFPTLRRKKKITRKRVANKKAKAAPVKSSGASSRKSKNRVVLTQSDLDNMRSFGLDPENKADLKAFAQQKM